MEDKDRTAPINLGLTLKHRKSNAYVTEYADRTVVLLSEAAGDISVNLIFGRDHAEVVEETLSQSPTNNMMQPTAIEGFRLDLASITLPAKVAEAMAEGILKAVRTQSAPK